MVSWSGCQVGHIAAFVLLQVFLVGVYLRSRQTHSNVSPITVSAFNTTDGQSATLIPITVPSTTPSSRSISVGTETRRSISGYPTTSASTTNSKPREVNATLLSTTKARMSTTTTLPPTTIPPTTTTQPNPFIVIGNYSDYMNECALPLYDFWDTTIHSMVDTSYNPRADCKHYEQLTELVNGSWRVTVDRAGLNCSARCHLDKGDYTTFVNETTGPGPVDCEVLETTCTQNGSDVYGYLHTQIIPKPQVIPRKFGEQPNVFVFMMDSMSTGQAIRSFRKTLPFMKREMGLIEFPYINKVGENSQPNGIPLWFGKSMENVDNDLLGGKFIDADWTYDRACNQYLDNDTHLLGEFTEYGYTTSDLEDWAASLVNWPNCYGFDKPPSHHHMHPFQLAYEKTGRTKTRWHLSGNSCREGHHAVLDYFQQFVDAYADRPMFTWTWLSNLGHDHVSGLMRFDSLLLDLVKKNKDLFDNSFFIIMGDHGLRKIPSFLDTKVGDFERNNPYFSMTVPKKYRNSGIVEEMRKNAQKLQTHFDTRATLLDILKFQPESNFNATTLLNMKGEKGHSYFRRQPDFPRTCGRLPIPNQFCICQMIGYPVTNETMRMYWGNKLIDHIHEQLEQHNFTSACVPFSIKEITIFDRMGENDPKRTTHNYKIRVKTNAPSNARFQTNFHHNETTGEVTFGTVARLDTYGNTGSCIQNNMYERLCWCKNQ